MWDIEIMILYAEKYGEGALWRLIFLWPVVNAGIALLVLKVWLG